MDAIEFLERMLWEFSELTYVKYLGGAWDLVVVGIAIPIEGL